MTPIRISKFALIFINSTFEENHFENKSKLKGTAKMKEHKTERRKFISTVIGGAAAFGLSSVISPVDLKGENSLPTEGVDDAIKWFKQLKGKHKMVFDMSAHHDGRAIGWALTLLDTYNEMGTPDKDISVVIILRAGGTPIALNDSLWPKYSFGEKIELKDPETKTFAARNLFAKCVKADDDCIELFQKRGGLVCVCNKALEGMGERLALKLNFKKEDVIKEFKENVLPGIHLVPSGIWALNHAQELGCTFSFGG